MTETHDERLASLYEVKYSVEGLIRMLNDGIKFDGTFFQAAIEVTINRLVAMKSEENIENLETHVAAIYYYLYRQAGCPFGDSLSGYDAWIEAQVKQPFETFAASSDKNSPQ